MVHAAVRANLDEVPPSPGALYVRPTMLGVDANIGPAGASSSEALLYVIASPVGEYFDSSRGLTVRVETELPRSTPQFGGVKTGANYAMALGITQRARRKVPTRCCSHPTLTCRRRARRISSCSTTSG